MGVFPLGFCATMYLSNRAPPGSVAVGGHMGGSARENIYKRLTSDGMSDTEADALLDLAEKLVVRNGRAVLDLLDLIDSKSGGITE